jgi:pyridoxamine 5'-phosphate oxidase
MTRSAAELREEYMRTGLSLRQAAANPIEQFRLWFEQAKAVGLYQPRAMALATVNALGRPSARMLLLAGFDERGFAFTTGERSPKAQDLRRQPWAALVFHWAELQRQVRAEGQVEALDEAETDAFFKQRARASQMAAWAARQSEVIASRAVLEQRLLQLLDEPERTPVQRPPDYGGFRLKPALMEFWQARSDHLNDRVRYRSAEDGSWIIELLAP